MAIDDIRGAILLSACTILPSAPVSQVYLLPVPPAVSVPHAQTVNWSLRVSQPATNQFLNSSRIAVQPQGQEIAVYKNSRWSDSGADFGAQSSYSGVP